MDNAISNLINNMLIQQSRGASNPESDQMVRDIRDTIQWIELLESAFELQSDPDLVESYIYEISAKKAKFRYLIRQAREAGISCPEFDFEMHNYERNAI